MAKAYQKPLKLSHLGFLSITAKAQLGIRMQSKFICLFSNVLSSVSDLLPPLAKVNLTQS